MSGITRRLAVSDIDFEAIHISLIFKIVESFVEDKIKHIGLFETENGWMYAIAEFEDENAAEQTYRVLDNTEIEMSGIVFNLSFVPDDFKTDNLIEECRSSDNYRRYRRESKNKQIDENMIEMSEEISMNFEIPDKFRTDLESTSDQKKLKSSKKESVEEETIANKLKDNVEEDDFKFDIKDDRFKALFENDEFMIDASNKKARQQKASRLIIEEKLKRSDVI